MRGVVTPICGLIAVACIVLGVLNATIWRPSREITATASVSGTRYVVTDPGVLGLVDDTVTMTVENDDAEATVCVAEGSMKDVTGWISGNPYVRVTGLSEWDALSVADAEAQGRDMAGDGDVAFADSDMWTAVECDAGSATFRTTDKDASHVALVDLGEDDSSAELSMHWVRHNMPNFAMPFYFAGGICVVMAVLCASVFAMPPHKRRKAAAAEAVEVVEETTGMGPGNVVAEEAGPRRARRRHGRGRNVERADGEPVIVDPSTRNMVSDQARSSEQAADDDAGEQTSVISPDELAAYFARLAQETQSPEPADVGQASDDSGRNDGTSAEPIRFTPPEDTSESSMTVPELSFEGLSTHEQDSPEQADTDDARKGE